MLLKVEKLGKKKFPGAKHVRFSKQAGDYIYIYESWQTVQSLQDLLNTPALEGFVD